ncbi:MAG: hypothetical protein KBD27_01740 [Candidatus Moranbacteria bacterium]|nr:hypothetical protein [Candidatus Moranbacteria bacterium]
MTKKQIFLAGVGAVLMLLVCVFVYRQYTQNEDISQTRGTAEPQSNMTRKDTLVPVPEKLDDITATITTESADDLSALDEEMTAVEAEIDLDSESVNNLGTSYDENSF